MEVEIDSVCVDAVFFQHAGFELMQFPQFHPKRKKMIVGLRPLCAQLSEYEVGGHAALG
jgi:hypothetical protein